VRESCVNGLTSPIGTTLGDALILAPEDGPYGPLLDSLAHFSDAFMADPADTPQPERDAPHP